MDASEFTDFAKATVNFVSDYIENIRSRTVTPNVEPGYLIKALPKEMPEKPEKWQEILKDVEQYIMPGILHWSSPRFHAYFPSGNSYPSIVADILSNGIGSIGLSWNASPAYTELEMIMCDWLGRLFHLPEEFLFSENKTGGGIIQGSASESTLVCLLAAKDCTIRRLKNLYPEIDENEIKSKLVAYTSNQSNSSVEKAGILASIPMKLLPVDDNCSLRGETLRKAIEEDIEKGLIPCYVVATLGTTVTCAFDKLEELGPICKKHNIWLHVDAAYAGAALVCPEYHYLLAGIEYVDSFNVNGHKWLLINFDASIMWVRNSRRLIEAFNVDRLYLPSQKEVVEYRHWQISLGRRFRALKLWFVFRIYGVEGLQHYIRNTIKLARVFERYVRSDDRFEIVTEVIMGLVCFRLKGDDILSKKLLDRLQTRRRIYMMAGLYKDKFFLRFVVCSRLMLEEDIAFSWNEISSQATEILQEDLYREKVHDARELPDDIIRRIANFNPETKEMQKI